MSVINKMLRDLDARHTQSPRHALDGTFSLRAGASTQVGEVRGMFSASPRRWALAAGSVAALLAALFVFEAQGPRADAPPAWQLAPEAVQVTSVPAAAPGPDLASPNTPAPEASAPEKPARANPPKEEVLEATRRPGVPLSLMLKLSAHMPPPMAQPSGGEFGAAAAESVAVANSVLATKKEATTPRETAVLAHMALQENLQQAQQLWQSGAREAALDVLRSTLPSAEKNLLAPDALALLREWARMALAQGQAAEVMAKVNAHAAQLQGQADLWALQGHAAQRLGLHAEAVEAYNRALSTRPEARWLLASAVSLAATGQADAAARQLQKARAQGPVNPEILAFLKQAGVVLPP